MTNSLPIGKVAGFRGRAGELTIRVASGEAKRWVGLRSVWIARRGAGPDGEGTLYGVESARAYRDRLVVKLHGVDDPTAADALRGAIVAAPEGQVPALTEGVHYVARLVGLEGRDEEGRRLGVVRDVQGNADDIGVDPQLFRCGDAIGVGCG